MVVALNAYYQAPLFIYFGAFLGFFLNFSQNMTERMYPPIPTGIIACCVLALHSAFANSQLDTKCWSRCFFWSDLR